MRIVGRWKLCDDGATRPVVQVCLIDRDGIMQCDHFLVDPGADVTIFSASFFTRLKLPADEAQAGVDIVGIGGRSGFVTSPTTLWLRDDSAQPARVHGRFAAFTDEAATDLSILGRDVLSNFDVILSRRRNEVLLLAPPHQYQVVSP